MQLNVWIILIAFGGAGLVALPDSRGVLVALLVQWAGIIGTLSSFIQEGGGWRIIAVEALTALVCVGLLGWTVQTLHKIKPGEVPGIADEYEDGWQQERFGQPGTTRQQALSDLLLQTVILLAGAVAGFGLARIYPLGGSEESLLAFYWIVLSSVLTLVLHGARDAVKQAVGLLVLLNAVALLVGTAGVRTPDPYTLGLLSLCRIGLAGLLSYVLVRLKAGFFDLDFGNLFDARSGTAPYSTALALVNVEPGGSYSEEVTLPDGEVAEEQALEPAHDSDQDAEPAPQEAQDVPDAREVEVE